MLRYSEQRLGDAHSSENDTGVTTPRGGKASHDETHDAQGGVMRITANTCHKMHDAQGGLLRIEAITCDEIHTEMKA